MLVSLTTAIIAVTAVAAITMLINDRFDESINRSVQQSNSQTIESVANSIDNYLKSMISISDAVTDTLYDGSNAPSLLSVRRFLSGDIDSITLFDIGANIISSTETRTPISSEKIKEQEWFVSAIAGEGKHRFTNPHVQWLFQDDRPWVISLSRLVELSDSRGHGVVLVDMNFNSIKAMCSRELGTAGYIYILGHDGKIIYHPRQQMIYAGIVQNDIPHMSGLPEGSSVIGSNGERASVCVRALENADWQVYGVSPLRGFFYYDTEIFNYIAVIVCVVAAITVMLAVIISLFLTRPVRRLMGMMEAVKTGEFGAVETVRGVYEVRELSRSFGQMVNQIKQLMDEIKKDQARLRKAEMRALQAQLSPHFLYNTLGSIVWMAEVGNMENVVKMTVALATYFRLTLSGGKEIISLEDELRHTENYLIIQKIKYAGQFDYTIECGDDLSGYMTLKTVAQPIVENAIIHGVGDMLTPGYIAISAYKRESMLVIRIRDNGCGIKPEFLKRILIDAKPNTKSGMGVRNVNERIQLMFGKEYGLKFESVQDEGTTVYINLPLLDSPPD